MNISVVLMWFLSTEREENVKADIFAAYQALLHRTKLSFVEQSSMDPSDVESTNRWAQLCKHVVYALVILCSFDFFLIFIAPRLYC